MKNNNPSDYFIPKHIDVLTEAQLYADIHMLLEEADLLNEVDLNKLKKAIKTGGAVAIMLLGAQLAKAQDVKPLEKGSFDIIQTLMQKFGKDDVIDVTDILSKHFPKEYDKVKKARGSNNPTVELDPERFDTPSEWNTLSTDMQKALWRAYVDKAVKSEIFTDKPIKGETIAKIQYDFTSGKDSGTLPIAKFRLVRTPDKIMTVTDKNEADRIKREEEERVKRLEKAFAEAAKKGLSEFEFEGGKYAVVYSDAKKGKSKPEKGTLDINFISGKSEFVRMNENA